MSDKCPSDVKVCPHCNNAEHTGIDITGKREKCDKKPKCANCYSEHNSFSKICQTFKREYAIQEIRVKQKITMYEARK